MDKRCNRCYTSTFPPLLRALSSFNVYAVEEVRDLRDSLSRRKTILTCLDVYSVDRSAQERRR